ncbi:hypothetical protein ERO13_D07G180301v2 [Gossypium hirsutum]|uniref:Phosphoinositide phospholipase C 5 n=1 Tax=Gossypium hirsutum TaxID=3635 RepID=A0A1U8P410_GOSHI|nr:phosphoinositide phospholipase C 5-like [Gossypium hirsutum]KAG4139258.1 hypothetical protein ERO13_D07G180301v2 [Gossypium hirsutum]
MLISITHIKKLFTCKITLKRKKLIEAAPPPDVIAAFEKYAEGGPQMTAEQLHRFLVDVQGQGGAKVSDAEEILLQGLQKRHHMAKFRKHALTLDDFHHYLFSANLNLPIDNKASLAFTSLVIATIPTLFQQKL